MANTNRRIEFEVGFKVNEAGLKTLKQGLKEIEKLNANDLIRFNGTELEKPLTTLNKIRKSANDVESALLSAYNVKFGTYNIEAFKKALLSTGSSIKTIELNFSMAGSVGQKALLGMSLTLTLVNYQAKLYDSIFTNISNTLKRSLIWSTSNTIVTSLTGQVSLAYGYIKNLDLSLNDIRIVTEKSAEEMDRFAEKANKAAQALGKSTTDYTKASLIYYQQGLSDEETAARTEVTLKAANVTQLSTALVSELLTAVWNGYKVSAQEAELYVDKLAAVAADTAADLEELSTGMSKVASAANMMGVDIDQMNAMLATTISVTRLAPETVGTAFKTILARMSTISAGGVDEEDGATLTSYTEKMNKFGINVLDVNGHLRDMGDVIEEVGTKWSSMSRETLVSLALAMAGARQYNNLTALFDNWDMYKDALLTSADAMGTLLKQLDIYMESTKAHLQLLTTSVEGIFDSLLDTKDINSVVDGLTSVANTVERIIDTLGGGKQMLSWLLPLLMMLFSKDIGKGIGQGVSNLMVNASNTLKTLLAQKNAAALNFRNDAIVNTYMTSQDAILNSSLTSEEKNKMLEKNYKFSELASKVNRITKPQELVNDLLRLALTLNENQVINPFSKIHLSGENAQDLIKLAEKILEKLSLFTMGDNLPTLNGIGYDEDGQRVTEDIYQEQVNNYKKQIDVIREFNEELANELDKQLKTKTDAYDRIYALEKENEQSQNKIQNVQNEINLKLAAMAKRNDEISDRSKDIESLEQRKIDYNNKLKDINKGLTENQKIATDSKKNITRDELKFLNSSLDQEEKDFLNKYFQGKGPIENKTNRQLGLLKNQLPEQELMNENDKRALSLLKKLQENHKLEKKITEEKEKAKNATEKILELLAELTRCLQELQAVEEEINNLTDKQQEAVKLNNNDENNIINLLTDQSKELRSVATREEEKENIFNDLQEDDFEERVATLDTLVQKSFEAFNSAAQDANKTAKEKAEALAEFLASMTEVYNENMSKGFESAAQGIALLGSGIAAVTATALQFGTAFSNIWGDEEATWGLKALKTLALFGSTAATTISGVGSLASGVKSLSSSMSFFTTAANTASVSEYVTGKAMLDGAIKAEANAAATKQDTVEKGKNAGANIVQGAGLKAATKAVVENTKEVLKNTAALLANPVVAAGAIIVAAIAAVTLAYTYYTKELKKNVKAQQENAKEALEKATKEKEIADQERLSIDSLAKAYEELNELYKLDNNLENLKNKTYELCVLYGKLDLALLALCSDYNELNNLMELANKAAIEAEKNAQLNIVLKTAEVARTEGMESSTEGTYIYRDSKRMYYDIADYVSGSLAGKQFNNKDFHWDSGIDKSVDEANFEKEITALMGTNVTDGAMNLDIEKISNNWDAISKTFASYLYLSAHDDYKLFNDLKLSLSETISEYQNSKKQFLNLITEELAVGFDSSAKSLEEYQNKVKELTESLTLEYSLQGFDITSEVQKLINDKVTSIFSLSADNAAYIMLTKLIEAVPDKILTDTIKETIANLNDSELNYVYLHYKWVEEGLPIVEIVKLALQYLDYNNNINTEGQINNLIKKDDITEDDKLNIIKDSEKNEQGLSFEDFFASNELNISKSDFLEADINQSKDILNKYYLWLETKIQENKTTNLNALEEQKETLQLNVEDETDAYERYLAQVLEVYAKIDAEKIESFFPEFDKSTIKNALEIFKDGDKLEKAILGMSNKEASLFSDIEKIIDYFSNIDSFQIFLNTAVTLDMYLTELNNTITTIDALNNKSIDWDAITGNYVGMAESSLSELENTSNIIENVKKIAKGFNDGGLSQNEMKIYDDYLLNHPEYLDMMEEVNGVYVVTLESIDKFTQAKKEETEENYKNAAATKVDEKAIVDAQLAEELYTLSILKNTLAQMENDLQHDRYVDAKVYANIKLNVLDLEAETTALQENSDALLTEIDKYNKLAAAAGGMVIGEYTGPSVTEKQDINYKVKFQVDYTDLDNQIKLIEKKLKKLQEDAKDLTGEALSENLKLLAEQQEKLLNLQKERNELSKQDLETKLDELKKLTNGDAKFDSESGYTLNASEILKKKELEVKDAADAWDNDKSNDDKRKKYEDLKNELDLLKTAFDDCNSAATAYTDSTEKMLDIAKDVARINLEEKFAGVTAELKKLAQEQENAASAADLMKTYYEDMGLSGLSQYVNTVEKANKDTVKGLEEELKLRKENTAEILKLMQLINDKPISAESSKMYEDALKKAGVNVGDINSFILSIDYNNLELYGLALSYVLDIDEVISNLKMQEIGLDADHIAEIENIIAGLELEKVQLEEITKGYEKQAKAIDAATTSASELKEISSWRTAGYDKEIDVISKKLSKLTKAESDLKGDKLINNLNQQKAMILQLIALKLKLLLTEISILNVMKMQTLELLRKINGLLNFSFNYLSDGSVDTAAAYKWIEKNAETLGDEARKAIIDAVNDINNQQAAVLKIQSEIDGYQDSLNDLAKKVKKTVKEKIKKEIDLALKIFNAKVDVELNVEDAWREINKLEKRILGLKDTDVFGNAILDYKNLLEYINANPNSYFGEAGGGSILILTRTVNEIMDDINTIQSGGTSDKYGKDLDKAFSDLYNRRDLLISLVNAFYDLIQAVKDSYGKMVDLIVSNNQAIISDYENINTLLLHGIDLNKNLYGEDSYAKLTRYYSQMVANDQMILKEAVKQRDTAQALLNSAKVFGTEEDIKKAQDLLEAAMNAVYEHGETLLDHLKESTKTKINASFESASDALAKSMGFSDYWSQQLDWERWKMDDSMFIDPTNTLYEMTTLANKFNEAISGTDSLSAKKKLTDVMNEQLGILLKQLDDGKRLTLYDVDRANKVYELTLRLIALEEAQLNKSLMRLRRDSLGNYRYEYIADDDKINDAKLKLLDAENDLYNFDKQHTIELQDLAIQMWEEYRQKILEIEEHYGPEETAEKLAEMQKVTEFYGELIGVTIDGYATTLKNVRSDTEEELTLTNTTIADSMLTNWALFQEEEKKRFEQITTDITLEGETATLALSDMLLGHETLAESILTDIDITSEFISEKEILNDKYKEELLNIEALLAKLDSLKSYYDAVAAAAYAAAEAALMLRLDDWNTEDDEEAAKLNSETADWAVTKPTTTKSTTGSSGGRMAYEAEDGNIYFASGNKLAMADARALGYITEGVIMASPNTVMIKSNENGKTRKSLRTIKGVRFDTGGYTGEWGSEGRIAMLHLKELVLNAKDTENILQSVNIVRNLSSVIDGLSMTLNALASNALSSASLIPNITSGNNTQLDQNVKIEANFPNVLSASEIEQAFNNLVNIASQRAMNTKR